MKDTQCKQLGYWEDKIRLYEFCGGLLLWLAIFPFSTTIAFVLMFAFEGQRIGLIGLVVSVAVIVSLFFFGIRCIRKASSLRRGVLLAYSRN